MLDPIYLIIIGIVVLVMLVMALLNRYRRCPSDKILVVYGSTLGRSSAKCVHGGGTFVWPVIQDYAYLSLTPIGIDANLTNALSRQNIRVDVPCRFTVGISTEPESMLAAAERLLGLQSSQIQEMARDILFGQLRLVIATMSIEELNSDRDKFLEAITANVEVELKKIQDGDGHWHNGVYVAEGLLVKLDEEEQVVPEYGCPIVEFSVKGRVLDTEENPIQNIEISHPQTGYYTRTAEDGSFEYEGCLTGFELSEVTIVAQDIDGEANGGDFQTQEVSIPVQQTDPGDGAWDNGKFEAENVEIVLTKK